MEHLAASIHAMPSLIYIPDLHPQVSPDAPAPDPWRYSLSHPYLQAPRPETIPSMSADEQSGAKLCVKPAWADRVGEVQWWYYKDAQGMPQGPHYPGQMRHWYTAGHFRSTQEIAPSFMGEVPQAYAPIFVVFKEPVEETAFVAGEGIANFAPTADEPVVEKSEVSRARLIRSLMNHVSQGSDEKEMGWC